MKYAVLLLSAFTLFTCPTNAQSLTLPLTFTNDTATAVITIGYHPNATDAFDLGIDELAPPPPPPETFDVRAIAGDLDFTKDLRSLMAGETVFEIDLTQAAASGAFTLQWDASFLSNQGTIELTDGDTGSLFGPLDMLTQTNLDILSAPALLEHGIRITIDLNENNTVSTEDRGTFGDTFALNPTFPNPFSWQTEISFSVSHPENVKLVVYDILGKEHDVLVDALIGPGAHSVTWDAQSEASGIYYVVLTAGNRTATRSMILTR